MEQILQVRSCPIPQVLKTPTQPLCLPLALSFIRHSRGPTVCQLRAQPWDPEMNRALRLDPRLEGRRLGNTSSAGSKIGAKIPR